MNIPLLKKVRAAILAEPKKFNMSMWFQKDLKSPCGTTACIAGHAISISRRWSKLRTGLAKEAGPAVFDFNKEAKRVLGIKYSFALFRVDYWPNPFWKEYEHAITPLQRARIAARRIDHFIKTKGAE